MKNWRTTVLGLVAASFTWLASEPQAPRWEQKAAAVAIAVTAALTKDSGNKEEESK